MKMALEGSIVQQSEHRHRLAEGGGGAHPGKKVHTLRTEGAQ